MKLKITGKIILSKIEIQTITIKHKITRKIIPKKNQDNRLVKLSLERKQAIDEIFYSFFCQRSLYEKNVRRLTDTIVKTCGFEIMYNSC